MGIYEVTKWGGGISDFEDKGIAGAAKFVSGADIRKIVDSLSCQQALMDIGNTVQSASPSISPSASSSPSSSVSASGSSSPSPSSSVSPSPSGTSPSSSKSPSASASPSGSASPSASVSPSHSGSPSPSPSAGLSTVFSDLIIKFVKASDGYLYGFGHTGKIYKINSDFYVRQVYDAQEQITGAEEKPSADGRTYLVWAGRTTVHHKLLPGDSSWNDVDRTLSNFPKTNLTDSDYHTMAQVGGDVMIANGSELAMLAYDDSYTNEALDLIPGNLVKSIIERNGRAVTGTYRAGDPDQGVNGMIDSEVPLMQVGDDGQLFYADFNSSMPVKRFPGGGKVNPSGVCNLIEPTQIFDWETNALSWIDKQRVGNLALFGVFGADSGKNGIYSYGRKDKNHTFSLVLDYVMDVDEIGAVETYYGRVVASYRDGTDYGVQVTDPNTKATAIYEGLDFKAPVKKPINITNWKIHEVYMKPLPSGASVQFWYKIDKTGSFIQAKTARNESAYSTANGKKAVFRIGASGDIFEPRLVLIPTGNSSPEVFRQRTYFV